MYHAADPIDAAADQEQKFLDMAIKKNSVITKRKPKRAGFCDYCDEPTTNNQLIFCSVDCRDADHHENKLRAINGRF